MKGVCASRYSVLELIALSLADAQQAARAGAHRIELVGTMEKEGLAPSPQLVEEIVATVPIRVRPMVRIDAGFAAQKDRLPQLKELVRDFTNAGAEGVVFGYLAPDKSLALDYMAELAHELRGQASFTIHRAIDAVASACDKGAADEEDTQKIATHRYLAAWQQLLGMTPGPDVVLTAGSSRGITVGLDNLRAAIELFPEAAELIQAGGGLKLEHIPALADLGICQFHVGSGVREDGTFDSAISAEKVKLWLDAIAAQCNRDLANQ